PDGELLLRAAGAEAHGDQAGEGGDEKDDADPAGQVAAQPGTEREQRGGGRDVAHRLGKQGVRLAAGRLPHLAVGERVAHLSGSFLFQWTWYLHSHARTSARTRAYPWLMPWR